MIDKEEINKNILGKNKLIKKSLALLLVLSMFLPSGICRNVFADEANPSVEFVYDLSEINGTKEVAAGQQKKFTVTAKLKNVNEIVVAGVSFKYDEAKLTATSKGKDAASYNDINSYQEGIWGKTKASKTDADSGVITYEAYVDPNCAIKETADPDNYTITSANTNNRLFSSTDDGYDFVTFTFTFNKGVDDIETDIGKVLESVKLNADVKETETEPKYEGYYGDGILLADGKNSIEAAYVLGNNGIIKLTLSGVYNSTDETWTGTKVLYIGSGTKFEDIELPKFDIFGGKGIVDWSLTNDGDAIKNEHAFSGETTIYAKTANYITFDLNGGSIGKDKTPKSQPVDTTKTFKEILIKAGFNNGSGEYAPPTKDHYTFGGWTNGDDATTTVDIEAQIQDDKPYALKANWTATEYDIDYHLEDGATNAESNPAKYTVEYNKDGTLTLEDPEKTGHDFKGWYPTAECEEGTRITEITKDNIGDLLGDGTTINLYPRFSIQTYKVTKPENIKGKYEIKNFNIENANYDNVYETAEYSTNASIKFDIILDESCNKSKPSVNFDGVTIVDPLKVNPQEDLGKYSVLLTNCTIKGNVKVDIVDVEKNTYQVILPTATGATLAAADGYNASSVEDGSDFKFTLTLDEAHNQSTPVIKLDGEALEREHVNGTNVHTYTIKSVKKDIETITVEDIELNKYNITLSNANDDIYFTTDDSYNTKKTSETEKIDHDNPYTFYVHYDNTENRYKGYKVKVNGSYLSDDKNVGDDKTIFTENHKFTTDPINADTTIEIEPVYDCAIKVVVKATGDTVKKEFTSIQAAEGNKILEKLKDENYQNELKKFLDDHNWLSDTNVSYKLGDEVVNDETKVPTNEIITITAQFERAKYVIKYTGATFNDGETEKTQDVSTELGDQAIELLSRTNIDPSAKIAEDKMFGGWKYEGGAAPTNTSALKDMDIFTAGPEFTAEWVNLGDFNNDNKIDLGDLAILLNAYGAEGEKIENICCSGKVNAKDLAALLAKFGKNYNTTGN